MDTTVNRGYPLLTSTENISDDFPFLNQAVQKIDIDVHSMLEALSNKANTNHSHEISHVQGLQLALEELAANDHTHKLDDLSDVSGAGGAGLGFLLTKLADGWGAISVSAAVGDIVDELVNDGLSSRAELESPQFTGFPKAPTQEAGNDSTALATTAFVKGAIDDIPSPEIPEGLPVGTSIMYNGTTAPTGYLKENGAAYSRTVYHKLFARIGTTFGAGDGSTTFNVPDTRAEFIRGLDDGRGIDVGRVLGVAQSSQNKSHTHTGSTNTTGNHSHSLPSISSYQSFGSPIFGIAGYASTGTYNTSSAGNHSHTLTINYEGGSEARPRNQAKLFCIKY